MNAAVRTVRRCLQRVRNTLDGTAVQLSAVEQEKLYLPFAEEWKNILIEPGGTPLDCVCIEDYSRWTLSTPEITNKIRELDALIKRNEQKISKIVRFAQLFVNDVLFFSSIVPSVLIQWDVVHKSQFAYLGELSRYSVQCIPPVLCLEVINELKAMIESEVNSGPSPQVALLSHINIEKFVNERPQMKALDAMLECSLLNFASKLRADIQKDPLYQRLKKSSLLAQWMLACSNSDEQAYLNTCDAGAALSGVLHYYPLISALLVYSRYIVNFLRTSLPQLSDTEPAYPYFYSLPGWRAPSVRSFVHKCILEFEYLLDKLTSDVNDLCDRIEKGYHASLHEMEAPVRKWHIGMQKLSAVYSAYAPIVNSKKLFSQQWHLSAATMAALSWLDQWIPGHPSFLSRSRAAHHLESVPFHFLHNVSLNLDCKLDGGIYLKMAQKLRDLRSEGNEEKVLECIEKLWNRLVFYGGKLYTSAEYVWESWMVGHVCFVFALVVPPECRALLDYHHSQLPKHPYRAAVLDLLKRAVLPKRWQMKGKIICPTDNDEDDSSVSRVFVIADPEIRWYKVLSFKQMADMIADESYVFDLANVSSFQKQK